MVTGSQIGSVVGPTHVEGIALSGGEVSVSNCEIFATNRACTGGNNITIKNSLLSVDSTYSNSSIAIIGLNLFQDTATTQDSTIIVKTTRVGGIGISAGQRILSQANNVRVDVTGPSAIALSARDQAISVVTNSSLNVGSTNGSIAQVFTGGHISIRDSTCNVNGVARPCP